MSQKPEVDDYLKFLNFINEEEQKNDEVVGYSLGHLTKTNNMPKEKVMHVLSDWKREQIEKIQGELKVLFTIEDMMQQSDSKNFKGYTDQKQFADILKNIQSSYQNTQ